MQDLQLGCVMFSDDGMPFEPRLTYPHTCGLDMRQRRFSSPAGEAIFRTAIQSADHRKQGGSEGAAQRGRSVAPTGGAVSQDLVPLLQGMGNG
jgi:hypothetical protein